MQRKRSHGQQIILRRVPQTSSDTLRRAISIESSSCPSFQNVPKSRQKVNTIAPRIPQCVVLPACVLHRSYHISQCLCRSQETACYQPKLASMRETKTLCGHHRPFKLFPGSDSCDTRSLPPTTFSRRIRTPNHQGHSEFLRQPVEMVQEERPKGSGAHLSINSSRIPWSSLINFGCRVESSGGVSSLSRGGGMGGRTSLRMSDPLDPAKENPVNLRCSLARSIRGDDEIDSFHATMDTMDVLQIHGSRDANDHDHDGAWTRIQAWRTLQNPANPRALPLYEESCWVSKKTIDFH